MHLCHLAIKVVGAHEASIAASAFQGLITCTTVQVVITTETAAADTSAEGQVAIHVWRETCTADNEGRLLSSTAQHSSIRSIQYSIAAHQGPAHQV